MTTRVLILGSTGSIGTQALEVISANRDRFAVAGLGAGGGNVDLLAKQISQWQLPGSAVAVADPDAAARVESVTGTNGVLSGPDAMSDLVEATGADVVLNAVVGSSDSGRR